MQMTYLPEFIWKRYSHFDRIEVALGLGLRLTYFTIYNLKIIL